MQTIWRALRGALVIEFLLCGFSVFYVLSGGIGPCGPSRDVPGFVRFIHLPGSWVSELLPESAGLMRLVLCIITTVAILTALVYVLHKLLMPAAGDQNSPGHARR